MIEIVYCKHYEAAVLAKHGNKVFAEVGDDLLPTRFFVIKGNVDFLFNKSKRRFIKNRTKQRGRVEPDALIRLSKTAPRFRRGKSKLASVYIATADLLRVKKQLKGRIRRDKLVEYLIGKIGGDEITNGSMLSHLLYDKKAIEIVPE